MPEGEISERGPTVVPNVALPPAVSPPRPTRRRWPLVVALVGLLLVGTVGGMVAYRHGRPDASAFRTVRVVLADITQRVSATGTLQPVITSPVGAQVSGIVFRLHADYNSVVKAGDLLVELDPALFHNAVAQATAQLAQAQATLTSTEATAVGARIARDRTVKLGQSSLASSADLDATAAIFGQSTGMARSSAALVALAWAQLERAKLDLAHSIIRSPVDGTVISRNVDVGQAVASTLTAPTLFTIAQDLREMQVHTAVDEADIGDVRAGLTATFTVDAFRDQTFLAVVHEVRNAPQTLSNVVTYDVVIDVSNPDGKLRPGMTANVSILIVQKRQVVALSNEALRFRPMGAGVPAGGTRPQAAQGPVGPAVYVPNGSSAERTAIKPGVTDGTMTEVEGVALGREVIVDVARDKTKVSGGGTHGG